MSGAKCVAIGFLLGIALSSAAPYPLVFTYSSGGVSMAFWFVDLVVIHVAVWFIFSIISSSSNE